MFDQLTDQEFNALWDKMVSAGRKYDKVSDLFIWARVPAEAWRAIRGAWQETISIRDDLFAAQYLQYAKA